MIPAVYDCPDGKGIEVEFDLENGLAIKIFVEDEAAQEMIDIIQNKLNARFDR